MMNPGFYLAKKREDGKLELHAEKRGNIDGIGHFEREWSLERKSGIFTISLPPIKRDWPAEKFRRTAGYKMKLVVGEEEKKLIFSDEDIATKWNQILRRGRPGEEYATDAELDWIFEDPDFGNDSYLCSVDSENRCILYKGNWDSASRSRVQDQFLEYGKFKKDQAGGKKSKINKKTRKKRRIKKTKRRTMKIKKRNNKSKKKFNKKRRR